MLTNKKYTPTLEEEMALCEQGYSCIAGLDEAGRGCLAGPVVSKQTHQLVSQASTTQSS